MKHISSCQCGEVELELEGPPIVSVHCHCFKCQEWSGAPYVWVTLFMPNKVEISKGKQNLTFSTSGTTERARCKSCSSHVYSCKNGLMYAIPGVYIKGIRRDNYTIADGFAPTAEIFYAERVKDVPGGLPTYDGMPGA